MGGDRLIPVRGVHQEHTGGDCGCEYHTRTHDVDRPSMSYTDYYVIYTKRCEKHELEYKEQRAKEEEEERRQNEIKWEMEKQALEAERAQWEAEKPERLEKAKQHILTLNNITTNNYTALLNAIRKYDDTYCVLRTGKLGMYEHLRTNFTNTLNI